MLPEKFISFIQNTSYFADGSFRHCNYNLEAFSILNKAVNHLPRSQNYPEGNFVYRGTLLRRLILNKNFKIVGNEPTEDEDTLNATRSKSIAEWYAMSYGDELAPAKCRIDPVIIVFDAKKLIS